MKLIETWELIRSLFELDCLDTPSFIIISNQGAPKNLSTYCVEAVFLIKLWTSKKFINVNVIFSLTVICKLLNEFEFFQRKRLKFLEQLRKNSSFFIVFPPFLRFPPRISFPVCVFLDVGRFGSKKATWVKINLYQFRANMIPIKIAVL